MSTATSALLSTTPAGHEHFTHPEGRVESSEVGAGTRVWAFAHILKGARIGVDCNICDHTFVEGDAGEEILLNRPDLGLHVPPMVWTTEYKYSPDAVLLVLASDIYREEDYIRDVDEFLALQEKMKGDICDPVP